jgi:hypothetical protein
MWVIRKVILLFGLSRTRRPTKKELDGMTYNHPTSLDYLNNMIGM